MGVSLVLQHLVLIVFDPTPRVVVRPYTNAYWAPFGLFINEARLFACLASLAIMVALYFFLTRSWTGRAMRATADDPVSAEGVASMSAELISRPSWSEPALPALPVR